VREPARTVAPGASSGYVRDLPRLRAGGSRVGALCGTLLLHAASLLPRTANLDQETSARLRDRAQVRSIRVLDNPLPIPARHELPTLPPYPRPLAEQASASALVDEAMAADLGGSDQLIIHPKVLRLDLLRTKDARERELPNSLPPPTRARSTALTGLRTGIP
jgi:hypothetical protein